MSGRCLSFCAFLFLLVLPSSRLFSHVPHNRWMSGHRDEAKKSESVPLEELLVLVQKAEENGERKEAIKYYKTISQKYPQSREAPWANYRCGILYESNHEFNSAINHFTKIVKKYPETTWFVPAVEHYFSVAKKLQEGVRPRYFGLIPGLRDRTSAIKNYESVVKYAPFSIYAPQALIEISDLQCQARKYDLAVDALDRLIDKYPDSVYVPDAYLKIADIYESLVHGNDYNQGGAITARRYYEEFCLMFPHHEKITFAREKIKELDRKIARAKISIGNFYFNSRNNPKAACILFREAIDVAPYSPTADEARQLIEEIRNGKEPKRTPVDFLFGKYKPVSMDEWIEEAQIDDRSNIMFEQAYDVESSMNRDDAFLETDEIGVDSGENVSQGE